MAKYKFLITNNAMLSTQIEAESEQEAVEKLAEMQDTPEFRKKFVNNARLSKYFQCQVCKVPQRSYKHKTYVEQFNAWYNSLLPGTEYTNEDIVHAINAHTDRVVYALKFHPAVRDTLLNDQIIRSKKIVYRKGNVAA